MKLSKFYSTTPPSGIRKIFNRIAEKNDVISFALGEPDFCTPPEIIHVAQRCLEEGKTHYTPNAGIWALREAIAHSYGDGKYEPSQVVVTAGGTEALALIMMALLNPGDEVILPAPCWPTYIGQIQSRGAVIRYIPTSLDTNFTISADQIEKAITPRSKLLIINSPCNPTGTVIPREEIEKISKIAIQYDLTVISDEVYRHIVYDDSFFSITDIPGMKERTILVDSFSKAYAMTGWRIGYLIAPPEIAQAITNLHEYSISCLPEPTQHAAIYALQHTHRFVQPMRDEFLSRRNLVLQQLQQIPFIRSCQPSGAFYLYFDISQTHMTSDTFVYQLLEEEKIALAPGTAFGPGQDSYVRLSYANSEENLKEGLARMQRFIQRHCLP